MSALDVPKSCACDLCGAGFPSKGARRRHKAAGCSGLGALIQAGQNECDDEHLYGRVRIAPEIKARAAAEWAAMDERGRLPKEWSYP